MWPALIAAELALAVLAWRRSAAHPRHRAVAVFVSVNVLADVVRQALAKLNAPAYEAAHGAPLAGLARVTFHADQALLLLCPFGIVAVAVAVFLERPLAARTLRAVAAGWLLTVVSLAFAYPAVRRARLGDVYFKIELAAVAAALVAGAAWSRRRERPTLTEASAMLLAVVEIGALVEWSPFARGWEWQTTIALCLSTLLVILHLGELWADSSSRLRTSS